MKISPKIKLIMQQSRDESINTKVNSKDTLSSRKRCVSLKIQDSLIEHVR
jgi:hypothetical protein